MEQARLETRRPGRPRSAAADAAILDAAVALVGELGYDAMSMDAVATRAGVGKATLYRRWRSKELLVAGAIERVLRAIPVPDTGSARGDLTALMRAAVKLYQNPYSAALLSALVAAMARSPRIARVVRAGFVATRRDAVRTVLDRGVARGELRPGLDPDLLFEMFAGPLYYRLVVTGGKIDARTGDALVARLLDGAKRP